MSNTERDILNRFARKLEKSLGHVDVILFGSRARHDNIKNSDFDVCVIVKKLNRKIRDKIYNIAWEISFAEGIFIAPLIFSQEEFEHSPITESPIYKNIQREGIKI